MSNNIESPWIPMQMHNFNNTKSELSSIQIFWDNVTGNLNGFVNILVTNNIAAKSILLTYSINSSSNKNNSIIVAVEPIYTFVKIYYTKNQINSGQLNVVANFKDL